MEFCNYDYSLYNYTDFAIEEHFKVLLANAQHEKNIANEELREKMCVYNRKMNKIMLRSAKHQKIKFNVPHMKARRY